MKRTRSLNRQRPGCLLVGLLLWGGFLSPAWASSSAQAAPESGPRFQAGLHSQPRPAEPRDARERRKQAYLLYTKAIAAAERGNFYRAMEILRRVIKLDPRSPQPYVTLGEFQYGLRNTREARRQAEAALQIDPHFAGAHKLLGRIYSEEAMTSGDRQQAKKAIEEFSQVVQQDDSDIEAWQSLAQLYGLTHQPEKRVQALTRWTSNDPTAIRAFYALASYYFGEGKYRQAAENASRALSIRSAPEFAILLGLSLVREGQTVDALRIFREARTHHPDNPQLQVRYAEALIYAGQYQEAIGVLQDRLKKNPQDVTAVLFLAEAYRRSGHREDAIQLLKQSLQGIDVSDSLSLQLQLARLFEEEGKIEPAAASYESALDVTLNPDGTVSKAYTKEAEDILTRMGLAYRQAGRRNQALRTFERMRKLLGPRNPQPDLLILDTLMQERNYDAALKQADEAIGRYPDKRDFRLLKAQILGEMGRVDEATSLLDGLLNNSIDDLAVLSTKALVLMNAERYAEAKAALEEGLRRDPKHNGLLIQLSLVQEKLQQPAQAEATLRAILKRDPDNPTVLNNLGYYLAERGEHLDEALQLTRRAVNIAPTEGSFLDSLGWVYFQMNQLNKAQRYLERALDFNPRDATIHEHIGDLYLRQGRLDQARRSFERSLEFAREKDQIQRVRSKLKELAARRK